MTHEIKRVSDEDIQAADIVMLVDPGQSGWQQLVWSTPVGGRTQESTTLQMVEIPVDSQNESQVEAARQRVSAIKGAVKPR